MHDDDWRQRLRLADPQPANLTPVPEGLARRARALQRRRARQRRVIAGSMLLLTLGWLATRERPVAETARDAAFAIGESDLSDEADVVRTAGLVRSAERHMENAQYLLLERQRDAAVERARGLQAHLDEESPKSQADLVAYRMVLRAQSLERAMRGESSVELYREVLRLFPNSWPADLARRHLTQLGLPEENT